MKKTTDKNTGKGAAARKRRPCFMAYTLNNTQPVICTLVADQPYFYMEEDGLHEEEDILGFDGYEDFERDLADLKKKMDAFDKLSRRLERDPERRLQEFSAEAINICEEHAPLDEKENIPAAERAILTLSASRMAKSLLDFANDHSVHIVESQQVQGARYEKEAGKIFVHPTLGETEQCLLIVRELRRHWQHRKGVMLHPLTFHPDHAILINRAQVADLTVAMVRVGWELQLAGNRAPWEFIENSSMADLARTFAREAFVDFRSLASGKASSAAFESWFLSERSRLQDKKLIQAMLADHQGYVFEDTGVSRTVSIDLIGALGQQPFGKNYLAPYTQMIIEDPVFTEVRDRSNANFLWFIKFERSFRETEQALQIDEGHTGGDVLSAPTLTETGKTDHGAESILIPLNRTSGVIHNKRGRRNGRLLEGCTPDTNVIHVRFGEGQGA